jgi:probable addiction module antidote protein
MSRTNPKPKVKPIPWDSAAYLKTDVDIAHYFEAVFEDGDPALVAAALGDIARAKGMSQIAQAAGLGRESLYKALSREGNPEFATVLKVMRVLGLKFKVDVPVNRITGIINGQRAIAADTAAGPLVRHQPGILAQSAKALRVALGARGSWRPCGKASQAHGMQAHQGAARRLICDKDHGRSSLV